MAYLYIAEFETLATAPGSPQIAPLPPIAQQKIAIGAEGDASA